MITTLPHLPTPKTQARVPTAGEIGGLGSGPVRLQAAWQTNFGILQQIGNLPLLGLRMIGNETEWPRRPGQGSRRSLAPDGRRRLDMMIIVVKVALTLGPQEGVQGSVVRVYDKVSDFERVPCDNSHFCL
jgi:hypothetical protein